MFGSHFCGVLPSPQQMDLFHGHSPFFLDYCHRYKLSPDRLTNRAHPEDKNQSEASSSYSREPTPRASAVNSPEPRNFGSPSDQAHNEWIQRETDTVLGQQVSATYQLVESLVKKIDGLEKNIKKLEECRHRDRSCNAISVAGIGMDNLEPSHGSGTRSVRREQFGQHQTWLWHVNGLIELNEEWRVMNPEQFNARGTYLGTKDSECIAGVEGGGSHS